MTSYDARYTRYQLQRSSLRKLVRRAYLQSALSQLQGPTVDFGCGVGELLERLPAGSVGLEINPVSVDHCRARGLDARLYDGYADDWGLGVLSPDQGLGSLVISHVLEHLDDPMRILSALLGSCRRLGISRVLVIVPGPRGYRTDATHRTFVDLAMLSAPEVVAGTGFRLASNRYFPGNVRTIGALFPHHELQVLFQA
jgi:SAM-dependent methyltransferase